MKRIYAQRSLWLASVCIASVFLLASACEANLPEAVRDAAATDAGRGSDVDVSTPEDAATDAATDAAADAATPDPYLDFAQLHVNGFSDGADDGNVGSEEAPFLTIRQGLEVALQNREAGNPTRVWIHPGVYRTTIVDERKDSEGSLIVLQGTATGNVVISGADPRVPMAEAGGVFSVEWTENWFKDECTWMATPNSRYYSCDPHRRAGTESSFTDGERTWRRPEAESRHLAELFSRREVVWVGSRRLLQVLRFEDLAHGAYFTDESADRIYFMSPEGVAAEDVEVAARETLWNAPGLSDYVLKDLVFERTSTGPTLDGGVVRIAHGENVLLENCDVREGNFDGLALQFVDQVRIIDSRINDNGFNGIAGHVVQNTEIRNTEASRNNWRGHQGLVHGWSVGNKFLKARNLMLIGFTAEDNLSHGLWFDFDNQNSRLEDSRICGNLGSGLLTEANQGPIVVRDNVFCDNIRIVEESGGGAGVEVRETYGLTLERNRFEDNWVALLLQGQTRRPVAEFETCDRGDDRDQCNDTCDAGDPSTEGEHVLPSGCVCHCLSNRTWRVSENVFIGHGDGVQNNGDSDKLVWSNNIPAVELQTLLTGSAWDNNTYFHSDGERVFGLAGCGSWFDFGEWQECTGKDAASRFGEP